MRRLDLGNFVATAVGTRGTARAGTRAFSIASWLVLPLFVGVPSATEVAMQKASVPSRGSTPKASEEDGSIAFYTRADLIEARTGQVEIRRAYGRTLALPAVRCRDANPERCSLAAAEEALYAQVYELTFVDERLRQERDTATTTRTDRGRLRIALELPKRVQDDFEDALREEVEALSPAAFALPQAGMRYLEGALSQSLLQQSTRPAWVCAGLDRTDSCEIVDSSNPRGLMSYSSGPELGKEASEGLGRAVRDAEPRVIRTVPDVLSQQRIEVRLRMASTLAGKTWSDTLAPIPREATFTKTASGGKKTGGVQDLRGEAFHGHEGRDGVTERDVLLPSASLELLGMPMWIAEWRFTTTTETFGSSPRIERGPTVSFLTAVAPVADPVMEALDRSGTALSVPDNRLVGSVLSVFLRSARLGPERVEEAFADHALWPGSGDWLIVGCAEDGTARYGIAPFPDKAKVTNALETCTAIRRELR